MTSDRQWAAVVARDSSADGRFVYAVATTGIYCRPSCPSRKPERRRVAFFASAVRAEMAGFRSCRRCHPDISRPLDPAVARVLQATRAVQACPDEDWPVARMATASGASIAQLQRAFRSTLRMSPRDFVSACRRRVFRRRLREGSNVTEATYEAGYGSSSRVYGESSTPGMTPATYARGGRGARIDWLSVGSGIGTILVAATARGVCFVEVGDTPAALLKELAREFPEAKISDAPSRALARHADAAAALANAELPRSEIPLDVRGTAFQWRVWRALAKIPLGETRTYSDVARSIGAPSSVRAVARACATNPVSLVIPCHRVVGVDGSLTGYRWGLDVKRALLDAERRAAPGKRRR